MKAILENVLNHSLITAFSFEVDHFEFKWHYHPEYELTLITKGKGMRLVGDNYENFKTGDLVLLGPGIPHTWTNEPKKNSLCSAIVIQFSKEFITNFMEQKEFSSIRKLLNLSTRGLYFNKNIASNLTEKIQLIPTQTGVYQITSLLNLLEELSSFVNKPLASNYFAPKINSEYENRINIVFNYIKTNAANSIALNEAANSINLTVSAFCKFFKKMTGKTFSDYVNDFKIGNACYLLSETDKPIYQIAHEIGFENQAYFNRVFLSKKACTPIQFRNKLNKKVQL